MWQCLIYSINQRFTKTKKAEYKDMQKTRIQKWVDDRFITGSVTWEMSGASHIKITDKTGDFIIISLDEIE